MKKIQGLRTKFNKGTETLVRMQGEIMMELKNPATQLGNSIGSLTSRMMEQNIIYQYLKLQLENLEQMSKEYGENIEKEHTGNLSHHGKQNKRKQIFELQA